MTRYPTAIYDVQLGYDRQVAAWLIVCAVVIFGMILLGGVTRLTDSGLSMVEWRPLMGVIPPMSEQAWLEVFEMYRQYPEYLIINKGMSLEEFKVIFMYEYLHRVLGRLIGVLFFLPLVYFAWARKVREGMMPKLVLLFFLGGLQGLLGWYMVKSGLVDVPDVSQYRLTAHLGLAVIIYAFILWLIFDLVFLGPEGKRRSADGFAFGSLALVLLVYLMILSGGLVAGTKAGLAYPTWPLMGDSFIPPGLYSMQPFWLSALEDITTIQFNHRMFAYTLFVVLSGFAFTIFRSRLGGYAKLAAGLMIVALLAQVTLGISTLLLHVPVGIGAAHQGGAVVLLSAMLFLSHVLVRQRVNG